MGREIRRVPADWEHPKVRVQRLTVRGLEVVEDYQPLFNEAFEDAARRWMDAAIAWNNGTDPDCAEHKATHPFYWQWNGPPPDPKYYHPRWTSEPSHYQVYETVSEGTPVTPHFATKAELVDWLVEHGDEWDVKRDTGGWERNVAERFVSQEWAPSMIVSDGRVLTPKDGGF